MTPGGKRVVLVAAVAENGVIGDGPNIPWKIPGEQAQFKELTMGHVLLLGRATYESIGRPLPGRSTVVLTRDPDWTAAGVHVAHDIDAAMRLAETLPGDVMVAGGGQVYAAALPYADVHVITEVRLSPSGDAFYPPLDPARWEQTRREPGADYDRVWWQRRSVTPNDPAEPIA